MYFTELCLKYAWEKYPLTLVWSLDWNDKRQADYISQCQKNPNLIEPEIVNDEMIETAKYLWEFWLEISWLQTIWRSWWSLIAYWTWYITNDLYLTEIGKQNLKSDLLAVSQEVNILGKLNKMKKFSTNIFKKRVTDLLAANIKWSKVNKPDSSKIQNDKLWNILDQNYRDWAKIWNWSTADSIRYQKATWLLVWWKDHIIKWTKDSQWLKNLIEWWVLSSYDKSVASKVLDDLTNALNGN